MESPAELQTFRVHLSDGTTHVSRDDGTTVFDGTASEALQYAIDAGTETGSGTVIRVAPGSYELEQSVVLASATHLAGSGVGTTLRAGAGLDADLLTVPTGAAHVSISDLRLVGNRSNNERGDCVAVQGGTWRIVIEHVVVRDGAANGIRFDGGPDGEYSYEPMLFDIDVAHCAGDGFVVGYTGDLFGANLYAEACGNYGFTLADAAGTLVHPHAYDSRGEVGIRLLPAAKDITLLGAHSERNRRHGILIKGERIAVRQGFIANNSRDSPGSYSGVVLDGARHCRLSASTVINDLDREQTQGYGLVETADSRNNRITANLFQHNVSAAVERESGSTGSVYRDNNGYRTENGGRTTVSDGGTIAHDLAEQPQQFWVESATPGQYAHVVDVDQTHLGVEVVKIRTGQPPDIPVDVVWGATVD